MGKNKKQRKAEREKLRRYSVVIVPEIEEPTDGIIPASVAIEPKIDELDRKILVTFEHYQKNACEIHSLDSRNARKLIDKLKQLTSLTVNDLPKSRLIRDNVARSRSSEFLYKDLPPDVDVKEIDFGKKERIFGYMVERYFCLVAITTSHPL